MSDANPTPAPSRYPKPATLRAEVLAALLYSSDMTDVDSPLTASTLRLATVIRTLTRRYRWPIESRDFGTNLPDGRAAWATVYSLPAETITAAFAAGAGDWIKRVRTARVGLRASSRTAGDQ